MSFEKNLSIISSKKSPFALELIEETQVTPAQDHAIRDLLCACFPPDAPIFSRTRHWHGTAPTYSLVHWKEGRAVGHVGMVLRTIRCGDQQISIAGVQNVAVGIEMRGSGLSRQLMEAAVTEAKRRGVDYGVLFCVAGLERFYASLGWVTVQVQVTMRDENGRTVALPYKNICMLKELSGKPLVPADLDLQGADW